MGLHYCVKSAYGFQTNRYTEKNETLSYFVKCTGHNVTSRESFAKWFSVASQPELISTIKSDVKANCSQSTVKSKDVFVAIKRPRERLVPAASKDVCYKLWVAQEERIWRVVNVSCEKHF